MQFLEPMRLERKRKQREDEDNLAPRADQNQDVIVYNFAL